jgi:hypothetical protein
MPPPPYRRKARQPSLKNLKPRRLPIRPLSRRTALKVIRTLHRQRLLCLRVAWSCRRLDRVRFTRHPSLPRPRLQQREPATWPAAPAFNAASRSSTAGPLADPAVIRNARLRERLRQRRANSLAARGPSIQRAQRRAAMPDPADPVPVGPERVPALAHGLVLVDHPVRVALAVHLVPAAHRQPAKHRVRSVPLRAEAAADGRSIPRPKKAQ